MPRRGRPGAPVISAHTARSCDGGRSARRDGGSAARNRIRRRLRLPGVFAPPCTMPGAVVVTPSPQPDRLDRRLPSTRSTTRRGRAPIAVGGVSIGAAVAAAWALAHPAHAVAVLAALPPWTGSPETAPAALAARHSADVLRRDGLVSATVADARIEPAVAGRRVDPVVGRAVAVAARRHGRRPPATSRRRAPSWRGWRSRWASPPRPTTRCIRWRSALEWVAAAPRAALRDGHARRDGRRPVGAGRGVRGRAVRRLSASDRRR